MIRLHVLGSVELHDETGCELRAVLAQPKRLALLCYLALATPRGFQRRDTLLALFWPELDDVHARDALKQAVRFLRKALGDAGPRVLVSRGSTELALDSRMLWCDAVAFRDAANNARYREAQELYRGGLLEGFYTNAAAAFDEWLESERKQLRATAAHVAAAIANEAEQRSQWQEAIEAAGRALELSGFDERVLRAYLGMLERRGDYAGAIRIYGEFARRLAHEYDAVPSAETRAVAARLRGQGDRLPPSAVATTPTEYLATPSQQEGWMPPNATATLPHRWIPRRYPRSGLVMLLACIAAVLIGGAFVRKRSASVPMVSPYRIAVFPFRILGDTDWRFLHEGAMDLVDGAVDDMGALRVVAPSALMTQLGRGASTDIDQTIARQASAALGAGRYILGTVVGVGRRATLSVSLYDARHDAEALSVTHLEVVRDSLWHGFGRIARELFLHQPLGDGPRLSRGIGDEATSDATARAYFRGEAMLRRGVYDSAGNAYEQAVREDTTFAIGWYRLTLARGLGAAGSPLESVDHAWRLRSGLGVRDRGLVEAFHSFYHGDGRTAEERAAAAVTAYPDYPEGWWILGTTQWWYAWQLGRSPLVARAALEQAVMADPNYREALHTLHILALYDRRYRDAAVLADRAYSATGPLSYNLTSARAVGAFSGQDTTEQRAILETLDHSSEFSIFQSAAFVSTYTDNLIGARRIAALMLDSSRRAPAARAHGHTTLALIAAARGDSHSALSEFAKAAAIDSSLALIYEGTIAAVSRVFTQDDARAIREVVRRWSPGKPRDDRALTFLTLPASLTSYLRAYALGLLAARLGDEREAFAYADTLERAKVVADSARLLRDLSLEIRALAAATAGDTLSALRDLEKQQLRITYHFEVATPLHERPIGRFLRAELLAGLGRRREALPWYASLTSLSMIEFVFVAEASVRAAELYEELGDKTKAVIMARRVLDRWQDCRPHLRADVEDARRRVGRLQR